MGRFEPEVSVGERGERYYKGKAEKLGERARIVLRLRIPFLLLLLGTQVLLLHMLGIEEWRSWSLGIFLFALVALLLADMSVSSKRITQPAFLFRVYVPLLTLVQSLFVALTGGILSPALPILCIPAAVVGTISGRMRLAWGTGAFVTLLIVCLGIANVVGWIPAPEGLTPSGPMWLLACLHGFLAIALSWLMLGGGVAHTASLDAVAEELEETRREVITMHQERLVALELFSGRIAHELKNPLSAIKGLTQLLERKGDPTGHLAVIGSEVQRLEEILGGFLSFSRPMDRLRPVPTDMVSLVHDVAALCSSREGFRNLAIEVHSPESIRPVLLDPRPIRQVLLNVLLNAQEATDEAPDGPSGQIRIGVSHDSAGIVVTVEDSGPGFPSAVAEQGDFSRFFDPYVTTKGRGTGLGLTVSRSMVRAHGGELLLANRPEGGACVTIRLPWEPVSQEDPT